LTPLISNFIFSIWRYVLSHHIPIDNMDDTEMNEAEDEYCVVIDLTEQSTPPHAPESQPGTDEPKKKNNTVFDPNPTTSPLDILAALSSRASEELNAAQTLAMFPKARPRLENLNINTRVATTIPGTTVTPSSSSDGLLMGTTNSTFPSSMSSCSATSPMFKSPLTTITPADSSTAAVLANNFPDCPMAYLGLNFAQDFPSAFPVVYFPNIMYLNLRALNLEDFQEHPDLSSLPIRRLDLKTERLQHELLAIQAAAAATRTRLMYVQQIDKLNTLQRTTLHYHRAEIDMTEDELRELRGHLQSNTAMFKRDITRLEATETELALAVVQRTEELEKTTGEKQKRLNSVPRFSGATWKHIGLTPKDKDNAGEGPAPK